MVAFFGIASWDRNTTVWITISFTRRPVSKDAPYSCAKLKNVKLSASVSSGFLERVSAVLDREVKRVSYDDPSNKFGFIVADSAKPEEDCAVSAKGISAIVEA